AQLALQQSQDPNANANLCPHCNKRAGNGKFCIECGKSVALAPAMSNPMPLPQPAQMAQAQVAQTQAMAQPNQMGQARPGIPQPRYGGLEVQNRDAMPNKRPSMIPNASQVAQMAQRAQQAASEDQGVGPLSQRVAKDMAEQAQGQAISNHRQPVTSLTPDISRLGLKPQTGGVEF
nr:hypothetical protein [bacterium]